MNNYTKHIIPAIIIIAFMGISIYFAGPLVMLVCFFLIVGGSMLLYKTVGGDNGFMIYMLVLSTIIIYTLIFTNMNFKEGFQSTVPIGINLSNYDESYDISYSTHQKRDEEGNPIEVDEEDLIAEELEKEINEMKDKCNNLKKKEKQLDKIKKLTDKYGKLESSTGQCSDGDSGPCAINGNISWGICNNGRCVLHTPNNKEKEENTIPNEGTSEESIQESCFKNTFIPYTGTDACPQIFKGRQGVYATKCMNISNTNFETACNKYNNFGVAAMLTGKAAGCLQSDGTGDKTMGRAFCANGYINGKKVNNPSSGLYLTEKCRDANDNFDFWCRFNNPPKNYKGPHQSSDFGNKQTLVGRDGGCYIPNTNIPDNSKAKAICSVNYYKTMKKIDIPNTKCMTLNSNFHNKCKEILGKNNAYATQINAYDCNPGYARAICLTDKQLENEYNNSNFPNIEYT